MFDKSQLMRGTLEGCILKIISVNKTYGYEIIEKLRLYGFEDIGEGTIYPLLIRLAKKNLITSEYIESSLGPKRKYYSISDEGIKALDSFNEHWKSISNSVNNILSIGGRQ